MAKQSKDIKAWLVQCGASVWIDEGRLRGATDLPLSDAGRDALASDLGPLADEKLSTVFHPSDEAAIETARAIAASTGARLRCVKQLADPDLGLLEGMTQKAFADRFPKRFKVWKENPLGVTPPDGEDLIAAQMRIFTALERVLKKARSPVAIVLHDLALGMFRCWREEATYTSLWSQLDDANRVEVCDLSRDRIDRLAEAAQTRHPA